MTKLTMADIDIKIKEIEKIVDGEKAISEIQLLAKEITGEDIIAVVNEGFEDVQLEKIYGSGFFSVDFAKLTELKSSFRYIQFILYSIVRGLVIDKNVISTATSHKYSFMDTLSNEEVMAVNVTENNGRKVISVIVDLHE